MRPAEEVWHDLECGAYRADIPLWQELVAAAAKRSGETCDLLEVGCGTGRVSLALAGADCRVTAVDTDHDLVEVLRQRARERRVLVDGVVADARSLELGSSFDLILAPQQFAQLFREDDRVRLLSSIARHLRSDGCAAVALLDLDEEWDSDADPLPPPDRLRKDGWDYSSQPVAVVRMPEETTLKLDRVRRAVSPDGEQTESLSRICLDLISVPQLESEAARAGLVPAGRRQVPATEEHVASLVVLLRHPDG